MRKAEASRKEDEIAIKGKIEETVGSSIVNQAVKAYLSQWLVDTFQEILARSSVSFLWAK